MQRFDATWIGKDDIAARMRRMALTGVFDGSPTPYLDKCTGIHQASGVQFIFTRDTGMHASGWFKNPDYERCWHLSLSFRSPDGNKDAGARLPYDEKAAKAWVDAFFGPWTRYVWMESPYSDEGKACDVWHHRVFCDLAWQPLIPRGEVYSREFTEKGWLSWSDRVAAEVAE